jgi:Cu+-exporting ATPase
MGQGWTSGGGHRHELRFDGDDVIETIRFPVAGMTCTSCVNRITRSLRRVDGVERIKVDLGRETVTLRRDSDRVSDGALAAAVAEAGYDADFGAVTFVDDSGEQRSWLARILMR